MQANFLPAYPDELDTHESAVIDCLIRDVLAADCTVSVFDGEEWPVKRSTDYTEITAAIGTTDETIIRVRGMYEGAQAAASFAFVHGNLPSEVLADMTDTPFARSLVLGAEACADTLEARGL